MPVTRKLSDILSGPYNRLKGISGFDLVDPMILSGRMLFGERGSLPSSAPASAPVATSTPFHNKSKLRVPFLSFSGFI